MTDLATPPLPPSFLPRIIIFGGFTGSGKTTYARRMAAWLAPFHPVSMIEQDEIRARLADEWRRAGKISGNAPIPTSATHPEFTTEVYERILAEAAAAARQCCVPIIAASFRNQDNQESLARFLGQNPDLSVAAFWLESQTDAAERRIAERLKDPENISDAKVADAAKQRAAGENLQLADGWIRINTQTDAEAKNDVEAAKNVVFMRIIDSLWENPQAAPRPRATAPAPSAVPTATNG